MSLSSRRAWIEIKNSIVAQKKILSLSSRRAWIEIRFAAVIERLLIVALLAESVD